MTIEPGAEVSLNGNYRLQVEGTLIARGTSETHVLFLPGEIPSRSDLEPPGIEFTGDDQSDSIIEFCEFHNNGVFTGEAAPLIQRSFFYDGSIQAEGGVPLVQHNRLEGGGITFMHSGGHVQIMHNQVIGSSVGILVWSSGDNSVTISHNIIEGATEGLRVYTRGGENIEIAYNTFRENNNAIIFQPGRTLLMPVDIRITSNNFIDSTYEHLTTHEYIESDIIATGNWWGTTNETEIQALIYDYYDDLNLPKVIWHPFLSSAVEDAL